MRTIPEIRYPAVVSLLAALVIFSGAPAGRAQPAPVNWFSIAGSNNLYGTNDGLNGADRFNTPFAVAADTNGNVFVADSFNQSLRKLTPAGTNWLSSTLVSGIQYPLGIAVDANSNLYVSASVACTLTKYSPSGTGWTTNLLAGSNGVSGGTDGTNGGALFNGPEGVALDATGNIYVADTGNSTIRKLTFTNSSWVSSTLAGLARTNGTADGTNSAARFNSPEGLTVAANGTIYVADSGNSTLRKIAPSGTNWITTTIAGGAGTNGLVDGTNKTIRFNSPASLALDAAGNLYVADAGNSTIRKLTLSGTNWISSNVGETNPGTQFAQPHGVTMDNRGLLYMADTSADTLWLGAPNFQILSAKVTNGVFNVSWTAIAGFTYQLQYKTNSLPGGWINAGATVTATNVIGFAADTNAAAGQRYYRIAWRP